MRNSVLVALVVSAMAVGGGVLQAADKTFGELSQLILEVDSNFSDNDPTVPKTFTIAHGWKLGSSGWFGLPVTEIQEYEINFGDGSPAATFTAVDSEIMRNVNHTYNNAGIYTITATVTAAADPSGYSRSISRTVLVGLLTASGFSPRSSAYNDWII